jgi:hypothetical protein
VNCDFDKKAIAKALSPVVAPRCRAGLVASASAVEG